MPQVSHLIPPSSRFWAEAARAIGETFTVQARVVVPTAVHAGLLREALRAQGSRIPLRISMLLHGWKMTMTARPAYPLRTASA